MIAREVALVTSPISGIKSDKLSERSMRLRKRRYATSNRSNKVIMSRAGHARFVFINDCAMKLPMLNLAWSLWRLRALEVIRDNRYYVLVTAFIRELFVNN